LLVGGCGIGGDGPSAAMDEEGGVAGGRGCHGDMVAQSSEIRDQRSGFRNQRSGQGRVVAKSAD
jgi:hypothetical protein